MADGKVRVLSDGKVGLTSAGQVAMREPCNPAGECPIFGDDDPYPSIQLSTTGIQLCSGGIYCSAISAPVTGSRSYTLLPHPDFPCCYSWEGGSGSATITFPGGGDTFVCSGPIRVMLRLSSSVVGPYGPVLCRLSIGIAGTSGWCSAVADCDPARIHVGRQLMFYYWQSNAVHCEQPVYGWRDNTFTVGQCCGGGSSSKLGYGGSALIQPVIP